MKCKICGQDNPPEAHFCANCGATLVAMAEPPSSAAVPSPPLAAPAVTSEYMGFWIRLASAVIDFLIISAASSILQFITWAGGPFWITSFLPLLYYWLFTGLKGQTPGKMALGIKVVDERGNIPGLGVAALREIVGKLLSIIVFCLGFLWIIWDKEKQGWHDKIAGTYVVKAK